MNVRVNGQEVAVFQGATVRDAVLRHFAKADIDKGLISRVEVFDKWGHSIGSDATLADQQEITYKIKDKS